MDTVLLKTFLEVTRTRNFNKASENLCVSSSTISARIKQLEDVLGLSLFIRRHHAISLTPAGERMERHARFILGAWERAFEDTALSERHQRRLVIGGVSSLWDVFLQDWLNDIYESMPGLSLRAEESTPLRVVEKLDKGMIDVGFMYEPPRMQGVAVQEVFRVPLVLVSDQNRLPLTKAISERYVRVEWGSTFDTLHETYFPQRPIAPVRVNSGRLALNLILNCGGAAYLPLPRIQSMLDDGHLHPVDDAPTIEMKAYAAYGLHGEHRSLVVDLLQRL